MDVVVMSIPYNTGTTTTSLSPSNLSFGTVLLNTTSTLQTSTLTNTGTAALHITSIAASGDFAQTNNCPISPDSLAPGASCVLSVTFTPTAINTRTGAVSITDDAVNSPQLLSLTGVGTAVTVSPLSINFGTVRVGWLSGQMVATLTNHGTSTVTVSSLAISGTNQYEFAISGNTCLSGGIVSNGSCTVTMLMRPKGIGIRVATLVINHNGGASPTTVALTGTGQ